MLTVPGLFFYSYLKKETKEDLGLVGKYAFIIGTSVAITTILQVVTATVDKFWLDPIIFTYIILLPISLKRLQGDDLLHKPQMPWKKALPILLALLIICFLYFQPTQFFIGGRDPGIYVSSAIYTSNTGKIQKYDALLDEARLNYPKVFQDNNSKYPGYYIEEVDGHIYMNPQFYPGYTLWLSAAHKLLGIDWFLYINPLLGMLSLLMLYTAVKEMFGRRAAAISTGLIAINIAQIYYARSPYTEILAQLLLWFSIFVLFKAHKNEDKLLAITGGFTIGAAILVRLDTILMFIPLVIYFVVIYVKDNSSFRRWWGYYIPPLMAVAVIFLGYVFQYGRTYTRYQLILDNKFVPNSMSLTQLFIILGIIALLGIFIVWLLRKPLLVLVQKLEKYRVPLINIISVLCVLAFIYMYFIRPHIVDPYSHLHANKPSMRAETLVRIGWYISFVGIWTALAAFIYTIRQKLDIKYLFYFLLVFLNFTVFLYDPKIHADHFWAVRRHVPFILPTFIIFMSIAVDKICDLRGKFKPARAGAALLLAFFLGFFLYCDYPFILHTDYAGIRDDIEAIARRFDDNDIIITSDTNTASRLVGTPLDLIYGKQVLPLRWNGHDPDELTRFIKDKLEAGKDVYFLLSDLDSSMATSEIYCKFTDSFYLFSYAVDSSYTDRPHSIKPVRWGYNVYQCSLDSGRQEGDFIDIGHPEDIHITMSGFYGAEDNGEINYRWTAGESYIEFTPDTEDKEDNQISGLTVRAVHFLAAEGPQEVKVYINDEYAGSLMIGADFEEYHLEFSEPLILEGEKIKIGFETKAGNPMELGMSQDNRDLGMMLDWIRLER